MTNTRRLNVGISADVDPDLQPIILQVTGDKPPSLHTRPSQPYYRPSAML